MAQFHWDPESYLELMRERGAAVRAAPGGGRPGHRPGRGPNVCSSWAPAPARRRGACWPPIPPPHLLGSTRVAGMLARRARARPGPRRAVAGPAAGSAARRPVGPRRSAASRCTTWTAPARPTSSSRGIADVLAPGGRLVPGLVGIVPHRETLCDDRRGDSRSTRPRATTLPEPGIDDQPAVAGRRRHSRRSSAGSTAIWP